MIYNLTLISKVGLYFCDQFGDFWSTFQFPNYTKWNRKCDLCDKTIRSGYGRSVRAEKGELHACTEHIQIIN